MKPILFPFACFFGLFASSLLISGCGQNRAGSDDVIKIVSSLPRTGSSKALKLAQSLEPAFRNVLLVAVELPSTLVDVTGTAIDLWQGNCTFGVVPV